jgi:hypothetical protein
MQRLPDPLTLAASLPADLLAGSSPLPGTPGQSYVERRAIPVDIAHAAGVRYVPDFAGRPAVIVPLYDHHNVLTSVHARYLHTLRGQDKMLTVGPGGGAIGVLGGWRAEPLIVVEGLFDALSLAVCGYACVATIGRYVPWLPEVSAGRAVWPAFDAGRSGDAEAARLAAELSQSDVHRLPPPGHSKDWNTALVKRGPAAVARWLERCLAHRDP